MSERTIWKFELPLEDRATVEMPYGARVLSVGCQGARLYLWAIVDPAETGVRWRSFAVRGTGHPMGAAEGGRFIGTTMMRGGELVWHVFDLEDTPDA